LSWDQYQEGMSLNWDFAFTDGDQKIFRNLSGDNNPIHHNYKFAKSKGFNAPIIYGMLLSSQISRLIGEELPDTNCILTGVKINFYNPVYANEKLLFIANLQSKSEATNALNFKFSIKKNKEKISSGMVQALWKA
jgi:acyl dehydratase